MNDGGADMQIVEFRDELLDCMRSINECLNIIFQPIADKYNLTLLQAGILAEVLRQGNHTVSSLSSVLGMTCGNTSSACKKLEKLGYLRRVRCPEDERCVQLAITETGRLTLRQIDGEVHKKYQWVLLNKSDEDIACITKGMRLLMDILQEMKNNNSDMAESRLGGIYGRKEKS